MDPIDFLDLQRRARDIVATPYDKDVDGKTERHERIRPLTITAIAGAYEYASHVVIAIRGTPTHGHVIINLNHDSDTSYVSDGRRLRYADIVLLKQFVVAASGTMLNLILGTFRWTSDQQVPAKP
jgi:hypothetical protein